MYDVAPAAKLAWHQLFQHVLEQAGLEATFIEHAWPQPIGELWAKPNLLLSLMCGWPYIVARQEGRNFQILTGLVPDMPAYAGLPRYRSEFIVRAEDQQYQTIEDVLGSRYGWMVQDSQSGWSAPRRKLAQYVHQHALPLFSESLGPHGNPHNLLTALRAGDIDVTALDGWYLDLIRAHDPEKLAGLRTLAYTDWTPNPLLVAGPDVAPEVVQQLRTVLMGIHTQNSAAALLKAAHIAKFVPVKESDYDVLITHQHEADALGYPHIV